MGAHTTGEAGFRWRGSEVTRLEGFTYAVFAFAVTLLVVSLEVPKTYPEFMQAMRGFLSFGICFALLANVWYEHYRYFRRYGLENPWTVFLNCALLFFVLFYVYPLKFMFNAALNREQFGVPEVRTLYSVFALGLTAVFAVFALLYRHAWQVRAELALSPIEALRTRRSVSNQLAMMSFGVLSLLMAQLLSPNWVSLAGPVYFLIPVYFVIAGRIWSRRERELLARSADVPPA
jgi:uncharacterized membrane protein